MADREHLAIGEVLSLLSEEFPDVTISKIRFLESQGLLNPERTPSGYRMFFDGDINRLQWILRQQRERFLPLKVIKERLNRGEHEQPVVLETPSALEAAEEVDEDIRAADQELPSLTVEELSRASGLEPKQLAELERYGLLKSTSIGPAVYYDREALTVAKLAASCRDFGVEARHLRMYKTAAQREADVFEQVVMPLLKQRNPVARRKAAETLEQLSFLGEKLRQAMLREALQGYTD